MKRIFVAVACALLSACGNDGSTGGEQTEQAAPKIERVEDVVEVLKAAQLPVGDVVVLTAETDSNQLLGRPSQYTGKLFFYDARHPKVEGTDENEATIEIFANAQDAQARHDYIKQMTDGVPVLAQYQFLKGRVLLRLPKVFTPDEAKAYEAAMASVD